MADETNETPTDPGEEEPPLPPKSAAHSFAAEKGFYVFRLRKAGLFTTIITMLATGGGVGKALDVSFPGAFSAVCTTLTDDDVDALKIDLAETSEQLLEAREDIEEKSDKLSEVRDTLDDVERDNIRLEARLGALEVSIATLRDILRSRSGH